MPARTFTPDDIARLEALAQRPAAELRGLGAPQRAELDAFFDWQAEQAATVQREEEAAAARADAEALAQAERVPIADLDPDAQREAILRLARAELAETRAVRREERESRNRASRSRVLSAFFVAMCLVLGITVGITLMIAQVSDVDARLARIEQATGQLVKPTSWDCRNADIQRLTDGTLRLENCTPALVSSTAAPHAPAKAPPGEESH